MTIKRIEGAFCEKTMYFCNRCLESDLRKLEQQRDEMLEALILSTSILEDIPGGYQYFTDTNRDVIFKATGKSWEEIKELIS